MQERSPGADVDIGAPSHEPPWQAGLSGRRLGVFGVETPATPHHPLRQTTRLRGRSYALLFAERSQTSPFFARRASKDRAVRKTHFRLAGCFWIDDHGLRRRLAEDSQPYQHWVCERPARGGTACPPAAVGRLHARFAEIRFGKRSMRASPRPSHAIIPTSSRAGRFDFRTRFQRLVV